MANKIVSVFSALAFWLVALPGRLSAAEAFSVSSPDGKLSLSFELEANPQPYLPGERAYYRLAYEGKAILAASPLGLDFLGAPALDHDFEILSTHSESHDDAWRNDFGARRNVRDHFNQLTVSLRERQAPHRRVDVVFRAYDQGVAFRYFLPKQEGLDKFTIASENSGFALASDGFAYALDLASYTSPYEANYRRIPLQEIKSVSVVPLPLLIEMPHGLWVAILEADLLDYAGMYLGGVPGFPNALMSKLSPLPDRLDQAVEGQTPKSTPWRVVMVGATPGSLIESADLVLNLSAPNSLADTSWIKAGKSAWEWWSGHYATNVDFQPGMNTATLNHYTDFAAEHHLEYTLIDAGWSPRDDITKWVPEVDLPAVLTRARERGVKVLLWLHWTAVKKQINEAFPLYEKWGVAGIKIDFMNRDDQEMVNFYEEMVRKAAEHHLVVDFHGAFKPTGLRRKYPNLLTREGVMGMEYSKWSDRVTPEHDVTLPYTRMLAGPFDYTPGCFNNATREGFVLRHVPPLCQGTRAHQLAMYVDFFSPLAMLSDYPESFDHNPGMEFLEKVPTVWDETRVLNGQPAKYVSIARRKGDAWYLGSMTNWEPRDLEIPLTFLGGGEFEAEVFADGADADRVPTTVSVSERRVTSKDTLSLHLAPGGGAAVIFTPIR